MGQTDRRTDRQTGRQTDRQRDGQTPERCITLTAMDVAGVTGP